MDHKIAITVVVNGQPTIVDANVDAPLQSVVAHALEATGNQGQPPQNWELRDQAGVVLDLLRKVGEFGWAPGVRLFLNLIAGIGGHVSDAAVR